MPWLRRAAFALFPVLLAAQIAPVKVSEDRVTSPAYRETPPDQIPPFDQLAINGSGNYSVCPYTLCDNCSDEKYSAPWGTPHPENEHLYCRVLLDLGQKLDGCVDKLSSSAAATRRSNASRGARTRVRPTAGI
jgi:hypothetical protein